jgi:hypothetical protein
LKKINQWIEEIETDKTKYRKFIHCNINNSTNTDNYFRFATLFSLLIDADKSQTALRNQMIIGRLPLLENLVDNFKAVSKFSFSSMNDLRNKAYIESEENLLKSNNRIFSVNLPILPKLE